MKKAKSGQPSFEQRLAEEGLLHLPPGIDTSPPGICTSPPGVCASTPGICTSTPGIYSQNCEVIKTCESENKKSASSQDSVSSSSSSSAQVQVTRDVVEFPDAVIAQVEEVEVQVEEREPLVGHSQQHGSKMEGQCGRGYLSGKVINAA